jgi:hypothetical protein
MKRVLPKINNSFFLITHNSDEIIRDYHVKFLSPKIIHWFAQNCDVHHSRISPLTIGLENAYYQRYGVVENYNEIIPTIKKEFVKIYFGFNVNSNPQLRIPAKSYISSHPLAFENESKLSPVEYIKQLSKYFFCLSPPGNGIDCHRTWECILLGVIPICIDSKLTRYFKKIGAPIFIIKEWSDLDYYITKDNLYNKYLEIMRESNLQNTVMMDYWIKKINEIRKNFK